MIEARAQELIVGCMATAGVIAVGSTLAQGDGISARQVFGFGFVTLGLAAGSMLAPDLAGSFAVLVLTSTVFLYGVPLYEAVTLRTSSTTVPSSSPSTSTRKQVANA